MERLEFSIMELTFLGSTSLQRIRECNETIGQNVKSKSYFYCKFRDITWQEKKRDLTASNGNKNAMNMKLHETLIIFNKNKNSSQIFKLFKKLLAITHM